MANKELFIQALTDPEFRKTLETNPQEVLGRPVTKDDIAALKITLEKVSQIESIIEKAIPIHLCTT